MPPRAIGALFGLVAALAFATALAGGVVPKLVPGWWDGHPTVNGQLIERKDVHVGLLAAYGCNLGENVVCAEVHTKSDRLPVGYAELAALGLIIVTSLLMMRSSWKIGDHRKLLGKLVLVEIALVAGGGVALFLVGPQVIVDDHPEIHIVVPIGIGMMVFWGAVAAAGVASVIAIRLEPEPLRLKRSEPTIPRQQDTAAAFDIHQLLAETHEPMRPSPPYNDSAPQPLAAPQLRPLYEQQNSGAPVPMAPLPAPRAVVGQIMGIPTPPALDVASPHASQPFQAQGPQQVFPHTGPQQAFPHTGPQQAFPNTGPQQMLPPQQMPPGMSPMQMPAGKSSPGMQAQGQSPAPPPLAPPPTPPSPMPVLPGIPPVGPGPRTAPSAAVPAPRAIPPPAARGKPSVPPPVRGIPAPKHPTISHAIPPPPNATNLPAPSVLAARDSAVRIDGEPITAVEVDAEAKAKHAAMLKMTPTPTPVLNDSTDKTVMPLVPPSVGAPVERTDESATVPPPTEGELAGDARPPSVGAPDDASLTVPRERPSFDAMETTARPKEEAPEDLQATMERNPKERQSQPKLERASQPKLERPASKPAEIPISTAPTSLPPPKKTTVTMTGPTPACPQCEAPMAWVEEHLRFYCAQCRMYF